MIEKLYFSSFEKIPPSKDYLVGRLYLVEAQNKKRYFLAKSLYHLYIYNVFTLTYISKEEAFCLMTTEEKKEAVWDWGECE